jgi:tetratricopeptide (TPR) repeat protein
VAGNWHPLTVLSHMLDVQLFGLDAGAHHLTNLVLHIACTVLLSGLLYAISGSLGKSAFVAGLFALHPMHVESVAWVSERKDVLSALFLILTLWEYSRYAQRPSPRRYLLALLCFGLGLMAKPMLVTVPFVLLLFDVWPLKRISMGPTIYSWRPSSPGGRGLGPLVLEKLPFFAFSAAAGIAAIVLQRNAGAMQGLPFATRAANALVSYTAYLGKLAWPSGLAALYPLRRTLPPWQVAASVLLLAAISFAALRIARRHPYVPVGWFWYLGTLVPVIGFIQVGDQSMADRYTYIPSIGLFIIVAWGVPDLLERVNNRAAILRVAGAAALIACAVVAHRQVQFWKNSVALWTRALSVTTDNHRAYNLMGDEMRKLGKLSEAIRNYSEAVRILPSFPEAHTGLADALDGEGSIDEAIAVYEESLRLKPTQPDAHNNLGNVLYRVGRSKEAIAHYNAALKLNPDLPDAHNGLGAALSQDGRETEAIQAYLISLRIRQDPDVHFNTAISYLKTKDTPEAIRHLEAALQLNPGHAPARAELEKLRSGGVPAVTR